MKIKFPDTVEEFAHCALLYCSPSHELEAFKHYVARFPEDQKTGEWLFDAFLFIRLINTSGVYADHAKGMAADWQDCLTTYFQKGRELDLLDQAITEVRQFLGDPPKRRKVILTIPYPHPATVGFGDIDGDGQDEDLSTEEGRYSALKWYIDEAIRRFQEANYENLDLWGFYWVDEAMNNDEAIVSVASSLIHDRGYGFCWIPYYRAPGYENGSKYFDISIMQPNYSFNSWTSGGEICADRLENCWEHCRQLGYGIEMELRGNTLYDVAVFQRYLSYGSRDRLGYQFGPNAYFLGTKLYSREAGPAANRLRQAYHMLCDYVTGKPVPDPDIYIDKFDMHQNAIYLLAGTEERISSVDLLLDTAHIERWNGLVCVDVLCQDNLTPGGWTLAARKEGERYQTISVPVATCAEILRIRIETFDGALPREAIRSISLDCSGRATYTNYCLGKSYEFLPDCVTRPYDDNPEGNLLINREITGQRIGWFSNKVQLWLDLGAEVEADRIEIYALRDVGAGIRPLKSGQVLFTSDRPVPDAFNGEGPLPQNMRGGVLSEAVSVIPPWPEIVRQDCRVKREKTRYISLVLKPEELHWLMMTQIRVLDGEQIVPVQSYRLLTRPSVQLGMVNVDDGRRLTDGAEASGYDWGVVLWNADQGSRTLVVDLEEIRCVRNISLHTLSHERLDIYIPEKVLFSGSADGSIWQEARSVNRCTLTSNGSGDVIFQAQFAAGVNVRYVRAEVVPQKGRCGISEITAC